MKRCTCCLMVSLLLALPALAGQGEQAKTEPEKPKIPLNSYLASEAQAVDCRFTLEYVRPKSMPLSDFEKVEVPDVTDDAKSVEQVVTNLMNVLPGVVVWVDKDNPKLVHLMDARLTKLPDYVMNRMVKVRYEGLLANLPNNIGSEFNANLGLQTSPSISDMLVIDRSTQVKINTTESIRSSLGNHLPKKPKFSIVWKSTTILTPKAKTEVQFYY